MKNKKIGKYQIQSVIGQGSFGKVYMAVAEGTSERVALKCILKKNRPSKQINNLKSQTELLTKIKHQNVIAMKECFETDLQLLVVMEYAGADLSKLLEKEKKLSEDKVRFFGKQILAAMLYLHQNRILHRDLKPQNILLQNDQIKICDFGFAKKMSASTNFLMSIKGTPLYIAPEILQSMKYTHKVDVWSLGIILYQLATGRTPFYASTIQQLQPKILHETVKFPQGMSIYLRELIDGMLQKTPSKRYDWDQVKNHKFFIMQPTVPSSEVNILSELEDKPKTQLKWNCEEQCAELMKLQNDFTQGKLQIRDLKYNEGFCFSVTRLLGQTCIDRSKVPKQVLLKTLRLITKMAMSKSEPKQLQDEDVARNKTLAMAVITLGLDQTDDDLLEAQLQLIGFLLKQNFYGVKIDSDYDEQIPTIISKQLSKNCSKPCANLCFKIFGILANQAITAFSQSEDFFNRIAEEKLLTVLANKYTPAPQNAIVLESLQKILHPRLQRTSPLTHKTKLLFNGLRQQCASILLTKGLIIDESPLSRHWLKPNDLQIYLQILLQCLSLSGAVRGEFLKKTYWKELLSNRKTKLYYIAYCYIILKEQGVYLLNRLIIQNQIVQDEFDNKLCNLYLVYFAYHDLTNHPTKSSKAVKNLVKSVKTLLLYDQQIKIKNSKEFFGFFSEDSKYFDTILIDILYNIYKDLRNRQNQQDQQILTYCQSILEESMKLPLSEHSLLQILQLTKGILNEQQFKKIDSYFMEMLQKDGFEDLLTVSPGDCTALLTHFLGLQIVKLADDREIANMAELLEKFQLFRFIFSQQILNQQLLLVTLKIVNKTIVKLKSIDFLATSGAPAVKKYEKTKSDDLKLEMVSFCCHLARIKQQYCHDLLQSGIIAISSQYLDEGTEPLKQKTLLLIGNLSKHNNEAFDKFDQHHIITAILRCITQCKSNKKILKNTIYAIGNISYYSQRFSLEIKPIIAYILEGLFVEDDHVLINTISTISNLLRHTSVYLSTLIDTGVIKKIIEIFCKSINPDVANYCCSLLKKAVAFSQFSRHFKKEDIRKILESNVKKGVLKTDLDSVKKLRQILV